MKVILKEDIDSLGSIGNVVEVKNGYGRNYLIPRDLAVEANPKNLKQFEHQKKLLLKKIKKAQTDAEGLAGELSSLTLTFEVRSGEDDKLFGSVTSKDVAEAIAAQGIEIDKRKINLQEPIKRLGSYEVPIKVREEVSASVKLEVKKAGAAEAIEPAEETKAEEVKVEEVKTSEEASADTSESTEA
jgi:large subunit ribosomal protein L9